MATLAGIVCFAGQDPRLDYSFAAPSLDESETGPSAAWAQTSPAPAVASKLVSVSFSNAGLPEVLGWMRKQGINFVMDEALAKNRRVTLNVVNLPIGKVMDAVAESLEGHWVQRDGIYVFRSGPGFYTQFGSMPAFTVPSVPGSRFDPPKVDVKVKTLPQGQGWAPRAFEWKFVNDEEIVEKVTKELRQSLRDSKVADEAFWERFSNELAKSLKKNLKERDAIFTDVTKTYKIDTIDPKALEEIRAKFGSTSISRTMDAKRFSQSLTPVQKELHKKQGYLKISDLTPEQREMLGIKGDGENIELEFRMDGDAIKVRSK
ncbi:MAG TPA: hypothetical protein VGE01_06380 [Fimbriimonas sp.]